MKHVELREYRTRRMNAVFISYRRWFCWPVHPTLVWDSSIAPSLRTNRSFRRLCCPPGFSGNHRDKNCRWSRTGQCHTTCTEAQPEPKWREEDRPAWGWRSRMPCADLSDEIIQRECTFLPRYIYIYIRAEGGEASFFFSSRWEKNSKRCPGSHDRGVMPAVSHQFDRSPLRWRQASSRSAADPTRIEGSFFASSRRLRCLQICSGIWESGEIKKKPPLMTRQDLSKRKPL